MDEILRELIATLPKSPTALDKSTVEKIHRYIPVPTDYKILWADIGSFGGYPAGVVITDRAIIVKASREEAKNNKAQIKEENKKKKAKEKVKAPKTIFQIIPWEYYSPEDYDVVALSDDKGNVHYVLKAGKTELAQFSNEQNRDNYEKHLKEWKNRAKKPSETFLLWQQEFLTPLEKSFKKEEKQ